MKRLRAAWLWIVACLALMSMSARAQRALTVSAHAAYAHAVNLGSESVGAWVRALARRSPTVEVGGEFGYYAVGAALGDFSYRSPTGGMITVHETRRHRFWLASVIAHYEMSRLRTVASYLVLGTGVYRFHGGTTYEERAPSGRVLRRSEDRSSATHPGVSLGLGVRSSQCCGGITLDAQARAHTILFVDAVHYPVLTVSIGVGIRIK